MAGPVATADIENFSRCFLQRLLDVIGTFLWSNVWVWSHTLYSQDELSSHFNVEDST